MIGNVLDMLKDKEQSESEKDWFKEYSLKPTEHAFGEFEHSRTPASLLRQQSNTHLPIIFHPHRLPTCRQYTTPENSLQPKAKKRQKRVVYHFENSGH
jgi:hypothetical protein